MTAGLEHDRRVVIVGGGTASASAIRTLRRRGHDGAISLVCEETYAPYQRPPLSKEYLAGQEGLGSLSLFDERWLIDHDVELISGAAATRVDHESRQVILADGRTLPASHVVLATGGKPRILPGAAPSENIHYLRTIDDADRLRESISPSGHLVVVGGGYIGLEVAATARSLGMEVTVFEAAPRPLAAALPPVLSDAVCTLHADRGTRITAGVGIERVEDRGNTVAIHTTDAQTVTADAVVVAIGMIPNVEIATNSGIPVSGGILADTSGRTAIPEVLTAGDAAEWEVAGTGRRRRNEHFEIAGRQGSAVANTILGRSFGEFDAPWFWSDQYDSNIQIAGNPAAADHIIYRGDPASSDFSALLLAGDVLVGAFGIDRGIDVVGARMLIGESIGSVENELADEDIDLVELADSLAESVDTAV